MNVKRPEDLEKIKKGKMKLLSPTRTRITVGLATCGLAKGAGKIFEALKYEVKKRKLTADVVAVGCNGLCYAEPIVEVIRSGKPRLTYGGVSLEKLGELVQSVKTGNVLKEMVLMRQDEATPSLATQPIPYAKGKLPKAYADVKEYRRLNFYKRQMKLVSANAGTIDPGSIDEYIASNGYASLAKVLSTMSPEGVIKEVTEAKLRGRGGAGFPTGVKWQACRNADGDKKYVVCNGSEGDPEIGMHRSFLESDPHLVIEGMKQHNAAGVLERFHRTNTLTDASAVVPHFFRRHFFAPMEEPSSDCNFRFQ